MRLTDLLGVLPQVSVAHSLVTDRQVSDICLDSRLVEPGAVFVTVAQGAADREAHVRQARAAGAVAVVGPAGSDADLVVDSPGTAAALLACEFHGHPSRKLDVVAVTGTNGKSSVTDSLAGLLRTLGVRVGAIGTIDISLDGQGLGLPRRTPTTPESVDLQRLLREFVTRGATHVVMEASSIALAEHRLHGTELAVGTFTNLTHDHLDAHGSMEAYRDAKLALFDLASRSVANRDDPTGRLVAERWPRTRTFGLGPGAALRATDLRVSPEGTTFDLHIGRTVQAASIRTHGEIGVLNALAVLSCVIELDLPVADAVAALRTQDGPPGRMQVVPVDQQYTVMVDYAHSPDALERVLRIVRPMVQGRIITVFGCGGDRDRTKRPIMGRLAAALCDEVIVTSDNPRTEDPQAIIDDVLVGTVDHPDRVRSVLDRSEAIGAALAEARSGDLVLVAGKGSESYQIVGRTQFPYSDEATIRALI